MSAAIALPRRVIARYDAGLSARVVRRLPMHYARGADPSLDRPAHVRAASGLAWVGSRLAVIQDDANFIALVDPATGLADSVALPRGPGGRRVFGNYLGTKADKLDHEALASIADGGSTMLAAFGSGSRPRRESIALVRDPGTPHVSVHLHPAPAFYSTIRAAADFAGGDLNIEGAVYADGCVRLFGRGNGAVRDGMQPVNATCDIDWAALAAHLADPSGSPPPAPRGIIQYDIGSLGDAPLSFTDAAAFDSPHDRACRTVLFTAAAEASPDAMRDGPVAGSAIGVIEESEGSVSARWTALTDERGAVLPVKAEGIAPVKGSATRLLVVVDADAHDEPSELLEVQLAGAWVRPRA